MSNLNERVILQVARRISVHFTDTKIILNYHIIYKKKAKSKRNINLFLLNFLWWFGSISEQQKYLFSF